MKINVTHTSEGWRPPKAASDFPAIYTIHIEGYSESQKTMDASLATVGTHEAEEYTAKSGKTYWRSIEPENVPGATEKVSKADPAKQESIEWQACLKAAVETVHDYNSLAQISSDYKLPSLADYKKQIVEAVVTFTQTLEKKPDRIPDRLPTSLEVGEDNPNSLVTEVGETITDMGDYGKVSFDEPPIESRVPEGEIDINELPF